ADLVSNINKKKYGAAIVNAISIYENVITDESNVSLKNFEMPPVSKGDYDNAKSHVSKILESNIQLECRKKKCELSKRESKMSEAYQTSVREAELMIQKFVPDHTLSTGDSVELSKIVSYDTQQLRRKVPSRLLKYGTFVANILEAEDSDDVAEVLDQAALPVGSWRIKRNSNLNVSINSYLGVEYSWFHGQGERQNGLGVSAPVGVTVSGTPCNGLNLGGHLSLLDLGAITSFRFNNDSSEVADIFLKEIIAPGAFFAFSLPGLGPLTIYTGYQWSPLLRSAAIEENEVAIDRVGRWQIAATVDIPLFNLFNQPKDDQPKEFDLSDPPISTYDNLQSWSDD
ncbi:MAG: hypothetical protein AAFQ02_10050, partial [Bacteroidota bacterium]